MKRTSCSIFALSIAMLIAAAGSAVGGTPQPVSPGGAAGFTSVATPCPTFSWSGVETASGYELVVYAVPEGKASEAEDRAPAAVDTAPVLRAQIPGRALSWTPSAESCLGLSKSYAWSVRALGDGASDDWSAASLFRVRPEPLFEAMGVVLERALSRYLEDRGLPFEPDGGLAAALAQELAAVEASAAPEEPSPAAAGERIRYAGGKRLSPGEPLPKGVFTEDVELWLEETGSGSSDKVQLVFATPEFDGDPSDAWAIVVEAEDSATAGSDAGKMLFSTPSFGDALQLFTDGSAIIGDLREIRILPSSSPPIACTSALLQGGMLYYDSDINALCACDGSSWAPVDADETGTCS